MSRQQTRLTRPRHGHSAFAYTCLAAVSCSEQQGHLSPRPRAAVWQWPGLMYEGHAQPWRRPMPWGSGGCGLSRLLAPADSSGQPPCPVPPCLEMSSAVSPRSLCRRTRACFSPGECSALTCPDLGSRHPAWLSPGRPACQVRERERRNEQEHGVPGRGKPLTLSLQTSPFLQMTHFCTSVFKTGLFASSDAGVWLDRA